MGESPLYDDKRRVVWFSAAGGGHREHFGGVNYYVLFPAHLRFSFFRKSLDGDDIQKLFLLQSPYFVRSKIGFTDFSAVDY